MGLLECSKQFVSVEAERVWEVGPDCISHCSESSWWDWDVGSCPLF